MFNCSFSFRTIGTRHQFFLIHFICQSPGSPGEVVVGFGTVAMRCYVGRQGFDDLLGCVEVGVAKDAEQTLVAKLTQFGVFGLVKSVAMW